jgi:hypothetical protein
MFFFLPLTKLSLHMGLLGSAEVDLTDGFLASAAEGFYRWISGLS